jgi:hypothetical protein
MAQDVLSLIPSPTLGAMSKDIQEAKSKANEVTADVFKKLMLNTGILEFDTESGTFKFTSDTSWMGIDEDSSNILDEINAVVDLANYGLAFGTQIYQNVVAGATQLQAIFDCVGKLSEQKKFGPGISANERARLSEAERDEMFNAQYAASKASLERAQDFAAACDAQLVTIGSILRAREEDCTLEPIYLDTAELDPFLSGVNFKRDCAVDPGVEEDEVFRLTYGPPVTTGGQYVLTNDGLYYDSRTGGLDPVFLAISGVVPVGDRWKYDYDPNLGGKGRAISIDSLNKFADNIFDPKKIDDSQGLQQYYKEDHFLAVLKQQRDKFVYDLSSDLQTYINDFGAESSIVTNQRQLIISEIANHNHKMNRRKKQIEVAVKAPQVYGEETAPIYAPGDVPINDFTYLEQYNLLVDLEKQRALIFEHAEVEGIVLPIKPKFVSSPERSSSITYEHLHVPNVGKGGIIYSPSGSPSGTVLSLTDQIVSDRLFAIYNFLGTEIELPSSTNFPTTNCATKNMYNNAQLVAANKQNVFFSGLAIPYFEGITKKSSSDVNSSSALGSFMKLPDSPEFRDMMYGTEGFTIECWVHVPDITDAAVGWLSGASEGTPAASSLTKVLIGSENTGAQVGASALASSGGARDLDFLSNERGELFTRGFLCGFTRDRRITQDTGFSNVNALNDPVSSLSFFVAPTQARDFSSVGFINNDSCQASAAFHKMKVDLVDTAFGNVSSQFVLVDITCEPNKDRIRMFADGQLVATSSMEAVFGTTKFIPPSLPSFKQANSFEYSSTTVDGTQALKEGPRLNTFYTPWIVGGGYTDGMYQYNSFLGGDRSGYISGLRGHVGSLKFYSKPLNTTEVLKNYEAQEGFFKNIRM